MNRFDAFDCLCWIACISYVGGEWESNYKPGDEEDEAYKELGDREKPVQLVVKIAARILLL